MNIYNIIIHNGSDTEIFKNAKSVAMKHKSLLYTF